MQTIESKCESSIIMSNVTNLHIESFCDSYLFDLRTQLSLIEKSVLPAFPFVECVSFHLGIKWRRQDGNTATWLPRIIHFYDDFPQHPLLSLRRRGHGHDFYSESGMDGPYYVNDFARCIAREFSHSNASKLDPALRSHLGIDDGSQ